MKAILYRTFSINTRNALHIYPPTRVTKVKNPLKEIAGMKLPIFEKKFKVHATPVRGNTEIYNDSKPENHIQIKVSSQKSEIQELIEHFDRELRKNPFILGEKPKIEYKKVVLTTSVLQTSTKKAKQVFVGMIGKHYYDAAYCAQNYEKKVGKFLYEQMVKKVPKLLSEHGMDQRFTFVTAIVINRTLRQKRLRYHARMKHGLKKRDFSLFKITLAEKPMHEFYRMAVTGKVPGYLSYFLREEMENRKENFEFTRSLQPFLTAKGRQQQRLMLNRKVFHLWIAYQRKGIFVRANVLRDLIIEKEIMEFQEKFAHIFPASEDMSEERMIAREKQMKELEDQNKK